MAQSDFASKDLIEVAAAGGTPRDWKPAPLVGSGILASLTCELFVRFQTQAPPRFDSPPGPRTALAREIGYWLVVRLERISARLPRRVAANIPQRACRSLQKSFTRQFVLPKAHIGERESAHLLERAPVDDPFRFEATRRVFRFENEDGARENMLICHVLSQREHRTTDRLLIEFVTAVGKGDEPRSIHCDKESGLCLWNWPSGYWAGKSYREVVIAPLDALPQAGAQLADTDTGTAHLALDSPESDSMTFLRDIDVAAATTDTEPNLSKAFDGELYERSEADWEFVAGEIERAYGAGQPLDDEFVESLAQRRLEHAKTYPYPDRPDAGPTLESSVSIVRSILNLHLTALRHYEAGDTN